MYSAHPSASASASSSAPSSRMSVASSNAQASSTLQNALLAKVHDTKKEYAALFELERLSAEYVRRLEAIDLDCHAMADAGRVIGEVLSQWPEMFKILQLSLSQNALQNHSEGNEEGNIGGTQTSTTVAQECERLVRVPIEELQRHQMQQQQH